MSDNYINATGSANKIITNVGQPAFSAYLDVSLFNVLGNGGIYQIICNNALTNYGSHYNTSTGQFTAPVNGMYSFKGAVTATGGSGISGLSYVRFINVTTTGSYRSYFNSPINNTTGSYFASISHSFPLLAGQVIGFQAVITDSGGSVVDIPADLFIGYTYFSGFLVG